jgi:hypothetical protein
LKGQINQQCSHSTGFNQSNLNILIKISISQPIVNKLWQVLTSNNGLERKKKFHEIYRLHYKRQIPWKLVITPHTPFLGKLIPEEN